MASRDTTTTDLTPARQYAELYTSEEELVIYMTENSDAWIQSDYYIDVYHR